MSFIALESTGNLWLTTAVLVAVIISTQITRELFGYSFATGGCTCAARPSAAPRCRLDPRPSRCAA